MPSNESGRPSTCSADGHRRLRAALPWLVVAAVAAVVFANTLWNGFVFDDRVFIEKGKNFRSLEDLPRMFGLDGSRPSYRPFRTLTYGIDRAIYGMRPWGFHLSNLLFHVVTSLLVLRLFRRISGSAWIATAGAALFAVHPIHVDAVTYTSGRKDVLATLFTVAALLVYLWWREAPRRRIVGTAAAAVGSTILFALGVFSKEMAVVLPALLVLVEAALQLRRTTEEEAPRRAWPRLLADALRRSAPILLPLALVGAAGCLYVIQFARGTHQTWHGGSIEANFATVTRIHVYYSYLTTLPFRLIGDYYPETFALSKGFLELRVLGSAAFLLLVVALLFGVARRAPLVWLGGLWFFVSLLPVSQIVPHHELVGERFLYLPSVGFCLLAAVLLERLRTVRSERFALAAVVVIGCVWGGRTVTRNLDYRDDSTFWSSVVRAAPRNARAHVNIGYNYYYLGKVFEAAKSIEKGLSIDPKYWTGHYNLGRVYEKLARYTDAIEEYRTELRYYENRDARFNLASLLGRLGRIEESRREFEEMVRRYPRSHLGWYYLGVCHEKLGDREQALRCYREALSLHPEYAEAKGRIRSLEGTDTPS